jgi:hypothetical protein
MPGRAPCSPPPLHAWSLALRLGDHAATGRARTWLAAQHPELYQGLYEQHIPQARADGPDASATAIRSRARSRALGDLQRRYPNEYEQRYAAELARAHTEVQDEEPDDQQPVRAAVRVPYLTATQPDR